METTPEQNLDSSNNHIHDITPVRTMYENWFLEYASYVILERAVPAIDDGLKPVQRRILYSMKTIDDGRYNKVANIIGQTMQYHPHGDVSIGDAMVHIGQKEFLIDTQGNWGDNRTGDGAAAARYIEARPSKFALDILYNPQTTEWKLSYDGRKKEPVTLPVKFPLLLLQGAEGIAVGLSTKILPHNFIELIKASIDLLKGKKAELLPDFPSGGMADCSLYNQGQRGGKVRIRAKIDIVDKKTLIIKEIPYSTTTSNLIDSIIKAHQKGKIKIKNVVDNTAKDIEILIQLAPGQTPSTTIDALYVFTDCEITLSPNTCVIIDDKPAFIGVNELLKHNTTKTKNLLNKELEIEKAELLEKILFASLEKIFIENRIYRTIEDCETWEDVILTINSGLAPYKKDFYRDINREDIIKLTEIKIKRISKFDSIKSNNNLKLLKENLTNVEFNLNNINDFTILFYKNILSKYGKSRNRKTELRNFDTITASTVVATNQKLYVNRKNGFIGYGIKKDEFIGECSDIDDIIVFRKNGKFSVTKISEKTFVGKDIIHVSVFNKSENRRVYNLIYVDGKDGITRAKRFQVISFTRNKEYDLTRGNQKSRILYFTDNPNGEAEIVTVLLSQVSNARKKVIEYNFSNLEIKGKISQGNIITKHSVKKVKLKEIGLSTLGGIEISYDKETGRLNTNKKGKFLGEFKGNDLILLIYKDGNYILTTYNINNRISQENLMLIEKYDPNKVISNIYYEGKQKHYFIKKFKIETLSINKKFSFITENKNSSLTWLTTDQNPKINIQYYTDNKKNIQNITYDLSQIDIKGWKTLGTKLSKHKITQIVDLKT